MIRIQNVYYMLAYAFQVLKEQGYASMVNDYVTPHERENNLKNRANRRKNFMK